MNLLQHLVQNFGLTSSESKRLIYNGSVRVFGPANVAFLTPRNPDYDLLCDGDRIEIGRQRQFAAPRAGTLGILLTENSPFSYTAAVRAIRAGRVSYVRHGSSRPQICRNPNLLMMRHTAITVAPRSHTIDTVRRAAEHRNKLRRFAESYGNGPLRKPEAAQSPRDSALVEAQTRQAAALETIANELSRGRCTGYTREEDGQIAHDGDTCPIHECEPPATTEPAVFSPGLAFSTLTPDTR